MGQIIRVLIVEDSEEDVQLLLEEMRAGGYLPVFERVDTAEAMRRALDEAAWDIVLSDYVMPQFGGMESLRVLQERGLDLPFIIVCGEAQSYPTASHHRARSQRGRNQTGEKAGRASHARERRALSQSDREQS